MTQPTPVLAAAVAMIGVVLSVDGRVTSRGGAVVLEICACGAAGLAATARRR